MKAFFKEGTSSMNVSICTDVKAIISIYVVSSESLFFLKKWILSAKQFWVKSALSCKSTWSMRDFKFYFYIRRWFSNMSHEKHDDKPDLVMTSYSLDKQCDVETIHQTHEILYTYIHKKYKFREAISPSSQKLPSWGCRVVKRISAIQAETHTRL